MPFTEAQGVLKLASGRSIGWEARGPADGRVVGWLHGQPGSRHDVRGFDRSLLERFGVRLLAIDRAGYGDTDPAGLDRRDVSADLLAVADEIGVHQLPLLAVSMGAIYALTLAAMAPQRISRVVLVSGHVLPYDDPEIVARLSAAEQADVALLRAGPSEALDHAYAQAAASAAQDPEALLRRLAEGWHPRERELVRNPWAAAIGSSIEFGLSNGHAGYLEDGLRTLRPLEVDLADVRCPVRAIHGTEDDLEPYANLERVAAALPDCLIVALPGMGHFGPWLWPDLILGLLSGA